MKKKRQAKEQLSLPRYNTPLLWLMLLSVPFSGVYHLHLMFLLGIFLVISFFFQVQSSPQISLPPKNIAVLLGLILLGHLLVLPLSVNTGMAISGFFRVLVWLVYYLYILTYTRAERKFVLTIVAYEAVFFALATSLAFCVDLLQSRENVNGRIDGLFEYANTWALYLLCSFVWILYEEKKSEKRKVFSLVSLTLGIFLTGSRGILLLLCGCLGFYLYQQRKNHQVKKTVIMAISLGVCLFFVANMLMDGLLTFRLTELSLNSSSINGRLLYYTDALTILGDNPLGIGRGGYLYLQSIYQTGIYTVLYVHNDYLQMALDGGIVAGMAFFLLPLALWRGKTLELGSKICILLLWIHLMVDFDGQYMFILWFLVLLGAEPSLKTWNVKKIHTFLSTGFLILSFSFFVLVYQKEFHGDYQSAYEMYPWDLSIAEKHLMTTLEKEEIAQKIVELTPLSMVAWDYYAKYSEGEPQLLGKFSYLQLNRYDENAYEELLLLLTENQEKHPEITKSIAEDVLLILEETQEKTSPFAYRIYDKVDFSWAEEMKQQFETLC